MEQRIISFKHATIEHTCSIEQKHTLFIDTYCICILALYIVYCVHAFKVLSQDKEMSTSPVFLRFLGFDPLADKDYFDKRKDLLPTRQQEVTEVSISCPLKSSVNL